MKKGFLVTSILILCILFSLEAFAVTYRQVDLDRGGMWANVLVDAGDEYKDAYGNFNTGGGWNDAHNLLGPIPDAQDPYAPVHSSIVTMNNNADSWVQLAFDDENGDLLKVWDDPRNPEGYDAIVWGNAFYNAGHQNVWAEPGTIYLSQDGTDWWKIPQILPDPFNSSCNGKNQTFDQTPGEGDGLVYPGQPWIFDGDGNKIGETGYAGGDAFDMATAFFVGDWLNPDDDDPGQVGLDWFQYMLLTGESPGGDVPLWTGPDPDSTFVFSTGHTNPVPIPGSVLLLGSGLLGLIGVGRRTSANYKTTNTS